MADTISQNITITATGGDEAAAEVQKSVAAINNVTSASSGMQTQFQERFQHIGLQLFAAQSLGAIGLSGETRQAVMLMNTALSSAEEAAGIASGGFTLLLTALVALGAVVYRVVSEHEDLIDTLKETHDAQESALKTTNDNVTALNTYAAAGGNMTAAMSAMQNSSENLRAAQIKQQEMTDLQTISTLKGTIAEQEHAMAVTSSISVEDLRYIAGVRTNTMATQGAEIMNKLSASVASQTLELDKNKASLAAAQVEYDNLSKGVVTDVAAMSAAAVSHKDAVIKSVQDEMDARRQEAEEEIANNQKVSDQFSKTMADMGTKETQFENNAVSRSSNSMQQKINNIKTWQNQQELALQNAYDKEVELILQSTEAEATKDQQLGELTRQLTASEVALNADAKAKMADADTKWYATAKALTDELSTDIGKSFAQMIVEGKSFSSSMQQMFEQMAEQFIEKVISMAIEWAVLEAVMDIWPGGAAAYQATAQAAYPAVAQGAYAGLSYGGEQADGGTYMVDKPTLFVAGESGPELAVFTPMSDINSSSSSSTSNNNVASGSTTSSSSSSGTQGTTNITVGDINVNLSTSSLGTTDVNNLLQNLATQIRTASVDAIRFSVTSANLAAKNSQVAV